MNPTSAAGASDADRFTSLFAAHYGRVLAFARRRADLETAQEVAAETFLVAWRRLDAAPPEALPWLYRIAGYELANLRRRQSRQTRGDVAGAARGAPAPDPGEVVVSAGAFEEAFAALSAGDREVLQLFAWEGLCPAEGAVAFGCTAGAFKVRLHRARKRLERQLARRDPSFQTEEVLEP